MRRAPSAARVRSRRPDAAASRLRIAYASCQRWEHGYFTAYRHMREENPDVVLFLGDYIYEYPNAKNAVRVPTGGWVRSLADYRARYALHKSDPDLQAMHAVCPWLLTWDDHEVQNDYAGLKEGQSGTPVADFAALRAAAYQAYYEHMPLRAVGSHQGFRRSRERRRDAHPRQRVLRHAGVVPPRRRPASIAIRKLALATAERARAR
jgi:phosphodiesterase/alkaline phosphatase D-like protein